MFWPAVSANHGPRSTPSSEQGCSFRVWLHLKSVLTGCCSSFFQRSPLFAHGCADVQDEDPGVAPQLWQRRQRTGARRGPGQAELRGRATAGPDSTYRGQQLGRWGYTRHLTALFTLRSVFFNATCRTNAFQNRSYVGCKHTHATSPLHPALHMAAWAAVAHCLLQLLPFKHLQ